MNTNRLLAIAGIIFAIAFVAGMLLVGAIDSSESDAALLKDTNDSGTQMSIIIGAYVLAVGGVMLLCFAARLRSYLGTAEGGSQTLARLANAGAIACAALIMGGALLVASVAGSLVFGGNPDVTNADVARFVPGAGFGIVLVAGMFSAIVMILSNSILILRTRALPTWYGWLGVVASIACVFGAFFIPAIGLAIWALVGGILMLGRTEDRAAAAVAGL